MFPLWRTCSGFKVCVMHYNDINQLFLMVYFCFTFLCHPWLGYVASACQNITILEKGNKRNQKLRNNVTSISSVDFVNSSNKIITLLNLEMLWFIGSVWRIRFCIVLLVQFLKCDVIQVKPRSEQSPYLWLSPSSVGWHKMSVMLWVYHKLPGQKVRTKTVFWQIIRSTHSFIKQTMHQVMSWQKQVFVYYAEYEYTLNFLTK